ncbi:hypothetical protein HMPREF0080_01327 [Anaeroglobus geminatus F0357]|uniref:Uncharacterized protein n=1 Tax=Anaeroglobus geminatus F0357 TaxID=861450 RepID=G9YI42_9FIRM|nr:hypothetical protein HMPREF0080_01327 [Anaeroglobus geminatus F0357]
MRKYRNRYLFLYFFFCGNIRPPFNGKRGIFSAYRNIPEITDKIFRKFNEYIKSIYSTHTIILHKKLLYLLTGPVRNACKSHRYRKKSKNNYTLYIVIKCLYVVECGEK